MIVICFDIDGVLCSEVGSNYEIAEPNRQMIDVINRFYERGCRIVLNTSRFMGRANGDVAEAYRVGFEFTREQLGRWGVRYHELVLGKPRYDIVVDDRSIFYESDCAKIEKAIEAHISRQV